ncbi:TACR3 [Branchiostoma lanceolatum]|uniref:TACR3 protein n=1 Tax=Branchiostoma lanceolatum TaxID=7740 RepID=A0A8K0EBC4_BRALA|nr:TACR3 [Branchiostoma lanceolatum]
MSITSSIVMLTVIAIDRFYAIIFPLKARITETNTAAVISTVWLISCAVNVPLLVVSERKQWQWDDDLVCREVGPAPEGDLHLGVVCCSVVVVMVAYFLLARKLWRTTSPGIAAISIQQLQLKAKKKPTASCCRFQQVIKMLVVVMTVFFVCWTPYHVLQIWLQFGTLPKESPPYFKQLRFVVLLLGYSNSAMNPIIYAGVNENFRKSFWDAYKCKHCRRNQVALSDTKTIQKLRQK